MHHSSSFYWSRNNSIEQSHIQKYQSEHPSHHKSAHFRKEGKVSPRVHKLSDPQRPNLPAQTYQRLCQLVPNPSAPILNPLLQQRNENTNFMSVQAFPKDKTDKKQQKVISHYLSAAASSAKTTPCSRKSSMKSQEASFFNQERSKAFDEEEQSRDLSHIYHTPQQTYKHTEEYSGSPPSNRVWRKKVSPKVSCFNNYGSTKTHLLQRPDQEQKEQKPFYSQNVEKEQNSSQQQHLTFRTNTATRVDTLRADRDSDFEGYDKRGGFTTFRGHNRAETEGDVYEDKMSTRRKEFVFGGNRNKENVEARVQFKSEEKKRFNSQSGMKTSFVVSSSASKCNREDGFGEKDKVIPIKSRQMSMQWTPREKVVGSLDMLSCSRVLFQSAKTERGNLSAYKREKSISNQYEDAEEAKMKQMIMQLRKKVSEKDSELSVLKNQKKSRKVKQDELEAKFNQVTMMKKRSDDTLEQINQQIACQEREKKCNERLESVLPNPSDYETNVESFLKKVREYEEMLQQKKEESKIVHAKVQKLEEQSQGKIEEQQNRDKTDLRKLGIELKVRDQDIKQLKEAIEKTKIHLHGFEKIGEKMGALENTQFQLIIENDRLKNLLPESEKQKFEKYLEDKSVASMIIQTSAEVNAIDDYTKNMTKILEALLKGREPPVEAMRLIPNSKKDKMKSKLNSEKIALSGNIQLKDLTKANSEITEVVHHRYMRYMDDICEQYARVCGNHCNLQ